MLGVSLAVEQCLSVIPERGLSAYRSQLQPEFTELFRISGIEVGLTANGEVWSGRNMLGKVAREQRFDQWFWRAYDADPAVEIKRFFTSRPEAIQLLLLRADLIEGIGF